MSAEYRVVRLYMPGEAHVVRVMEAIFGFRALYISMMWRPDSEMLGLVRSGERGPYEDVRQLIGVEGLYSFGIFRSADIAPNDDLFIQSIEPSNSIEINLSGIGEAIDAAAEICDPLRRQERREKLRHATAMNRAAEQGIGLENQTKSLLVAQQQIALFERLVASGAITADESRHAIRTLLGAQDMGASELEGEGVNVLEVVDDESR